MTFPCPWAHSVSLPDWQPKYEDSRVPGLTYTGVPVSMEMEASSTGTPVAANAVFTSLLAGGPKAFISVLAAVAVRRQLHARPTLAHEPAFRVHAVALARGA